MKISKKKLDKVLDLTRDYWESGDFSVLRKRIDTAEKTSVDWCALINMADAMLSNRGFCPDAPNELVYETLRLWGWEVADEEHPTE